MLKYIELKSGYSDNGPAWIARVAVSRSGRTVYFNAKALKRASGGLISGNHYDIETGEEYWVSGVKKNGADRHWAGSGKITIEAGAVEEYLQLIGEGYLDKKKFEISREIQPTDPSRFAELENPQDDAV